MICGVYFLYMLWCCSQHSSINTRRGDIPSLHPLGYDSLEAAPNQDVRITQILRELLWAEAVRKADVVTPYEGRQYCSQLSKGKVAPNAVARA
jgi:hypothetical protein